MKKYIHSGNNFYYLTASIVLLLLTGALVYQYADIFGSRIIMFSTVVAFIICTYTVQTHQRGFIQSRLFSIIIIAGINAADYFLDLHGLFIAQLLFLLCFYCWIAWLVAQQALFTNSVSSHNIFGAIGIYLLLGVIWALLYMLVLNIAPGSFNGVPENPDYNSFPSLLYFSFVTLTTLGYGDISPALPLSQFLVYMEAITGQFYIAVVIASLIGAHISQKKP